MSTIFLTGITGTLGSRIAELAVKKGDKVIGLVRKKNAYRGLVCPSIQLVEGELFSELSQFLAGVDIVIHAAAETRQSLPTYKAYYKINVEATALLLQTAVKCKVKQFIYISTANTFPIDGKEYLLEEINPMPCQFKSSFYAKSKYEAEMYLFKHKHLMDILIANPTFMIGVSTSLRSSNTILTRAWRKCIILVPPGGKNFVSVTEVAECILAHKYHPSDFTKMLINGQNLSYQSFYKRFIEISKQKSLLFKVPCFILTALGHVGDTLRKIGIQTNLSSINMKLVSQHYYFSIDNMKTNLNNEHLDDAIKSVITKLKSLTL